MKKLWSISFIKDEDGFKTSPEYDDELDEIFAKPGDIVELSFDETDGQPRFTLTNETEDYLEELYDLDIPPPPDLKAEYFLDLITLEYEKIKLRANKALQTSYNEEELSLFVNKNVQRLKKIAAQAHLLSRRLRTKDQSILDDPDSYIILILKIYLIRSICFYQDLFKPYLKVPVKDKFELRTSLYGEKHPTVIIREWEERDRNNLYKRLSGEINRLKNDGNDNNLDQQIHSLKNLTLNENWLKTVAEDAVSNGFIGKSHLVFIMASDKSYAKNLILTQLIENMFSEIKERKDHYRGFRDLSTSDYKSRIDVWSELIGHWVKGNYKFYKDKYKNYLPLYCLDLTTKDLHRFDPEQKNCQVRSEGRVENCYVIRYASQFIKLSELKKYMVDVLRIPPPSALFPDNELFNLDGEKQILIEKLRPSQKSKNECRKIAKKIWGKNPQITIADMINHKDLLPYTTKKNGDLYAEKTVRNWIKDLCPDRSRGRRKST
jgi:hypothetical protein